MQSKCASNVWPQNKISQFWWKKRLGFLISFIAVAFFRCYFKKPLSWCSSIFVKNNKFTYKKIKKLCRSFAKLFRESFVLPWLLCFKMLNLNLLGKWGNFCLKNCLTFFWGNFHRKNSLTFLIIYKSPAKRIKLAPLGCRARAVYHSTTEAVLAVFWSTAVVSKMLFFISK